MPIKIRIATKKDAELIADISRTTFLDTFAAANTKENIEKFLQEQFNHAILVNEVGAPDNIFLLAIEGDEIAGYARLRENNSPPALAGMKSLEISRIYATKNNIGKGIGKILMQECLAIARHKNIPLVWLGVWEHNKRAIEFYLQWGFEKFGTHIFILGDDKQTDWLMKKKVKEVI